MILNSWRYQGIKARTYLPPGATAHTQGTQLDYIIAKGAIVDDMAKQAIPFQPLFVPTSGCRHLPVMTSVRSPELPRRPQETSAKPGHGRGLPGDSSAATTVLPVAHRCGKLEQRRAGDDWAWTFAAGPAHINPKGCGTGWRLSQRVSLADVGTASPTSTATGPTSHHGPGASLVNHLGDLENRHQTAGDQPRTSQTSKVAQNCEGGGSSGLTKHPSSGKAVCTETAQAQAPTTHFRWTHTIP